MVSTRAKTGPVAHPPPIAGHELCLSLLLAPADGHDRPVRVRRPAHLAVCPTTLYLRALCLGARGFAPVCAVRGRRLPEPYPTVDFLLSGPSNTARAKCGTLESGIAGVSHLASTCGIRVGGMPCRLTNIVAKSAARRSSMPNISLNMKPSIRSARSAEARRFSTYQRHLSRRRQKRVEFHVASVCLLMPVIDGARGAFAFGTASMELHRAPPV
jgi:hypothetical protein